MLTKTPPSVASRDHAFRPAARSHTTRIVHLLLLLVVVNQLASSQFMEFPLPGDPPSWAFLLHEYIGLAGVVIAGAFWIWTLLRHGETQLGRLVPWFSPARLRAVLDDVALQLQLLARLNAPGDDGALASAVHGLGLLAVTAMVVTGTVFFVAQGTPVAHAALSAHRLLANLIWIYVFAHAGIAAVHHLLGSDILSRMFWVRRPPTP